MKKLLIVIAFIFLHSCAFGGGVMFSSGGVMFSSGGVPGLLAYLGCYQDNGEALDVGGVTVTAVNITHGTGHDSIANASVVTGVGIEYHYPANETNGLIDSAIGSAEFWYKHITDVAHGYFLSQDTSGSTTFLLRRDNLNNNLIFTVDSDNAILSVTTDVWDTDWHKITITWNQSTPLRELFVDGVSQSTDSSAFNDAAIPSGDMWVGSKGGSYAAIGEIQDVKFYDIEIVPTVP